MHPFDLYPKGGLVLLGRLSGSNARREYGLALQRLTGLDSCAYCGVNLVDENYRWLHLTVDHVVPQREAERLGIPTRYYLDAINTVLSCSACNGFKNRYVSTHEPRGDWTDQEFVALRDEMFAERHSIVAARHDDERRFFESQPWRVTKT